MNALLERLSVQSLFAYIEEVLTDNGFSVQGLVTPSAPTATMTMAYPDKDDSKSIIFPLIIVSYIGGTNIPKELGADDITEANFIIDVFAKDNGQRDDLGYLIRKNLNNKVLTVYDFNDKFPTIVGNYSGISTKGKMMVVRSYFINPEPEVHEFGLPPHHQEIRLTVEFPTETV